ncbi:unnamed protein product [Lactuca virosa]|uniref:Uncharacterized protein n=1 Tax=Lactuca virosa TaxID=75947 RepID=A0AAU9PW51_9ASTR|nr:unnamed protein product [Lactuca virosa]
MHEWLDEHKYEVVGNIEEETLDGAGLFKEVATGHWDVGDIDDEEENGDEDDDEYEDANDDEDDHQRTHFFIKDNGMQVDMGENSGVVATLAYLNITPDGPYVDPMYLAAFFHNTYKQPIHGMNGQNMWPSTDLIPPLPPLKRRMPGRPTIKRRRDAFERIGKHTISKESINVTIGVGDDEVMVDASDALERTGKEDQMVKVNARVHQVQHVKPPNKRKKSERIIKINLAKNVRGEGGSLATPMELD